VPSRSITLTLVSVARLVRGSELGKEKECRRRGPNNRVCILPQFVSPLTTVGHGFVRRAERTRTAGWRCTLKAITGIGTCHGRRCSSVSRVGRRRRPPPVARRRRYEGRSHHARVVESTMAKAHHRSWRQRAGRAHRGAARRRCIHPWVGACTGEGTRGGASVLLPSAALWRGWESVRVRMRVDCGR
jgi:hypothetical protein